MGARIVILKSDMTPTEHTENVVVTTLRATLGVVFGWLGLLKIAGYAPILESIGGSVPYFGISGGVVIFGVLEAIIGLLLFINMFWRLAEPLLIVYMIGTAIVFFVIPSAVFRPEFPLFSGVGELLVKNIALGVAGIVVMIHENRRLRNQAESA